MLYLFDKCYRKGDPKLMHVCLFHIFFCAPCLMQQCHTSTAPKLFSTSMEVHHAYRYMSTSTISLLTTAFARPKHPMMMHCSCSYFPLLVQKIILIATTYSWGALSNPDAAPPKTEIGLVDLFVE